MQDEVGVVSLEFEAERWHIVYVIPESLKINAVARDSMQNDNGVRRVAQRLTNVCIQIVKEIIDRDKCDGLCLGQLEHVVN